SWVRSQAIPPRKSSLQENLYSYESRNYNFLKTGRISSEKEFGKGLAACVVERAFDPEACAKAQREVLTLSVNAMAKWLQKRSGEKKMGLIKEFSTPHEMELDINRFKLMVKADAKVKLDASCLSKHPPAQNIMFHDKYINALFSPIFDEFKNRLMSSLADNIVFFTEMSNSDLAEIVRRKIGDEDVYHVAELDISKFDKSQDGYVKAFEEEMYRMFGFDPELLEMWMRGEKFGHAKTLDGSLRFNVINQRRSGASNTWIGNTLVTLSILCMYYDIRKFPLILVSGDDSLIYSYKPIKNYATNVCNEIGFEMKFMQNAVPYFCSKFLVQTGFRTVYVPDPYKLLVKLGGFQKHLTPKELFEVFVSFRDLTVEFDDQIVLERLALLVQKKYEFESGTTLPALCSIHCVRSNFLSFCKLFPHYFGFSYLSKFQVYAFSKIPNSVVRLFNGSDSGYNYIGTVFGEFDNPQEPWESANDVFKGVKFSRRSGGRNSKNFRRKLQHLPDQFKSSGKDVLRADRAKGFYMRSKYERKQERQSIFEG
ncbi:RNA-dependent RNA polymerase, partial [Fig virus A]